MEDAKWLESCYDKHKWWWKASKAANAVRPGFDCLAPPQIEGAILVWGKARPLPKSLSLRRVRDMLPLPAQRLSGGLASSLPPLTSHSMGFLAAGLGRLLVEVGSRPCGQGTLSMAMFR